MSELQSFSAKAAAGLAWALILALFPQIPLVFVASITTFILGLLGYAFLDLSRAAAWRSWAPHSTAIVVLVGFVIWIGQQPGETTWIGYLFGSLAALVCVPLVLLIVAALMPSVGSQPERFLVPHQINAAPLQTSPAPAAKPTEQLPLPVQTSQVENGPIDWDFAKSTTPSARAELVFGFASGSAGFWVSFFRLSGKNVSEAPLTNINAYVVPEITRERVPLKFEVDANERVDTDQTYGIPPGAAFVLAAAIPSPPHAHGSHGLNVPDYLNQIGGFTFVFEYDDGTSFTHKFRFAEVKAMIEAAEARYGPKPALPRVTKRGG